MIATTGSTLVAGAHYVADGVGKTGLTVTCSVYRNGTQIVNEDSASEAGEGLYTYTLDGANTGTAAEYFFVFKTADTTVDQKHLAARYTVSDGVPILLTGTVEGSLTVAQVLSIMLAVLAGKSTGGGSSTLTFRDQADSKARVTATVDKNGNRSSVTVDGS